MGSWQRAFRVLLISSWVVFLSIFSCYTTHESLNDYFILELFLQAKDIYQWSSILLGNRFCFSEIREYWRCCFRLRRRGYILKCISLQVATEVSFVCTHYLSFCSTSLILSIWYHRLNSPHSIIQWSFIHSTVLFFHLLILYTSIKHRKLKTSYTLNKITYTRLSFLINKICLSE